MRFVRLQNEFVCTAALSRTFELSDFDKKSRIRSTQVGVRVKWILTPLPKKSRNHQNQYFCYTIKCFWRRRRKIFGGFVSDTLFVAFSGRLPMFSVGNLKILSANLRVRVKWFLYDFSKSRSVRVKWVFDLGG